jgi:hypothetical protein
MRRVLHLLADVVLGKPKVGDLDDSILHEDVGWLEVPEWGVSYLWMTPSLTSVVKPLAISDMMEMALSSLMVLFMRMYF